ncbi:HprK-related kinase A [Noviherbaspirillum sedimenti]|uniref:HprK-related kinase A n=1 Tax=Noviherbaspirillum sedimenti TaxID=2320865 RepID=A0A3A3G1S2_9BURK|nr:HprK-related kinase A [Noviherbaspirillum sedimenti]RJG01871.1 HprK-related kinase A [Noviherbaspirillum sedimenti]
MNISALSPAQLQQRLRERGLCIRTGPFVTRVHTSLAAAAEGIGLLYADYPLAEEEDFADFHIRLALPNGLRRWLKPQVLFLFDGTRTFKPLPADQAFPMFEWGLNWCVSSHAQSYLIIHAAVLEKHGHAVILPAPPGSGKSTLCAALAQRGWRLLSDELALIRIADGCVVPLPRPVSLKNASIDIMRQYTPDAVFSRQVRDTMKGTVAHMKAPADSVARASECARPGWVIFPRYEAGADARLTVVPKARAFMRAADNAFNYSLLGQQGFASLAGLIGASSCYDFTYSKLDEAIDTFNQLALPALLP